MELSYPKINYQNFLKLSSSAPPPPTPPPKKFFYAFDKTP